MQDCKAKGRNIFGAKHKRSKLTDEKVLKMRSLRKEGETYQKIADDFGINLVTCWMAVNKQSWKHVT